MIADKGYDSTEIVTTIQALGAVAVIPPRRHWKQPRSYDRALYKQRNLIERCFNRLKHFRRFSRNIEAFRSCTALACAWLRLQLYVDTPSTDLFLLDHCALPKKADGITVCALVAHGMLKQHAHDALCLVLGRRRDGHLAQPLLHRNRLHFTDAKCSPQR